MPKDFYDKALEVPVFPPTPRRPKMKFRDWYKQRHGEYPTHGGEEIVVVINRMADAMADWCDLVAAGEVPLPPPPQSE